MNKKSILTGPWHKGIDSQINPAFLSDDQVAWSTNMINRGGSYQTRPRYCKLVDSATISLVARGLTVFTTKNGETHLVKACGTIIRISRYPFTTWSTLSGITLDPGDGQVHFETAIKGAVTHDDGTLEVIEPYPVLMIQTGLTRAAYWDGVKAEHLEATKEPALSETPIGTFMKWVGSRLWVAQGSRLRVSNILDPLKFTEEDVAAEGGIMTLPGSCTGLAATADIESLLAFTADTTTAFRASITQREPDPITGSGGWLNTTDFQRIILPGIGCVAGKTIVNQYGVTWWFSQGGFIGLDSALQTYRTSRIAYKDNEMARSKANLSDDVSRACAGSFENFMMLSVPSGDIHNAHTWVMDQGVVQGLSTESSPAWVSNWIGTRPVQWVTANINGKSRCFFYSMDYYSLADWSSGVWEAFCPVTKDIGSSNHEVRWELETKFMNGGDLSYKEFDHFKLGMEQIARNVHIDGYYASKHSGYRQVLDKDIVATIDSMDDSLIDTNLALDYMRQTREIISASDDHVSTNLDGGAESQYNRSIDYGFTILLQGSGVCSIPYISMYYKPYVEQTDGKIEADETTNRYIEARGTSAILTTLPDATPSLSGGRQSSFIAPVKARHIEIEYSSN